jgi:4-amino-4-deoxy-L-arabinose transferase-like glycosyltransferase
VAAFFNRTFRAALARFTGTYSTRDAILISLVLVLAIVSFWPEPTVADHVYADTVDYAFPALNFLHGHGFVVMANGHKYPPAHSFGLSLLLSAVYATFGTEIGNGAYLIFLFGLATILLTYYIVRELFDRRAAAVACVLLAVASQFRFHAKVIGADGTVSVFFCLASQALLFAALRDPHSSLWIWALLGQALGFAVTVRPDNVLLLLPSAVLLVLYLRSQNRPWVKLTTFASGILFWGMLILLANFLYTGDWFRTGYAVNYSAQHDRLGGNVSWRYFLIPSFRESNFVKLLRNAPFQWSLFGGEDPVKRWFYYAADAFLLIGLIQVVRASKREMEKRDLLIWSSLWLVSFVLFFSCYFGPTDPRYLQRVVPYFCLFTAVGLVICWDFISRMSVPLGSQLRRSWLLVWLLRVSLFVGLGGAGVYMFFHPHVDPYARVPQSAYLRHVVDIVQEKPAMVLNVQEKNAAIQTIPEKDAMILTDWPLPWMEYFFAGGSQRGIIPLRRFNPGADSYVQWKRPPHPEWINEDCTKRDNGGSVRYRRMYENGAQDLYPYTVLANPEVIDSALQSGRSVYVVTTGGYTIGDKYAMILLIYRYNLESVEDGWVPNRTISKEVRDIAKNFTVAKVTAKQNPGIHVRGTADGHIALRGENGVEYMFPARLKSASEDGTQLKIVWDGEHEDPEQILRFSPDGRIQIRTRP